MKQAAKLADVEKQLGEALQNLSDCREIRDAFMERAAHFEARVAELLAENAALRARLGQGAALEANE